MFYYDLFDSCEAIMNAIAIKANNSYQPKAITSHIKPKANRIQPKSNQTQAKLNSLCIPGIKPSPNQARSQTEIKPNPNQIKP